MEAKAESEKLLLASTLDLSAGWQDAAALGRALKDLGLPCQEVGALCKFVF